MSKITLTDLSNLQNENTAVNAININSEIIELAFDNTISRDGTSPNQMEASLDMNSNPILNLPTPTSNYEPLRLIDVATLEGGGITVSPLPIAGTTRQVLEKNSNTNYDVSWKDSHEIPVGGSTAQVLAKNSTTNYDAGWTTPHYIPMGGILGQVLRKNSGTDYDTSWVASSATVVDSIAQLKALAPGFADNITVRGYYAKSDGGGGSFYWDTPSVVPDNGGTVIQPNAGGTGRWIRYWGGESIDVKWFGAKGDGVTLDTAAIANAMTVAISVKGTLYISPAPVYYLATITIPNGTSGLKITGDGKGYPSVAGPGSVILNNTSSNTLDITSSTGTTDNIVVKGIKLLNTGGGYPLRTKQCNWSIFEDLICISSTGAILLEGSAISSFINIQAYGGTLPALTIQDGSITAAGPFSFIGGIYAIQGGTATSAIAITGSTYSTTFYNVMYSAVGPNMVAGVTIDGTGVASNTGTVNFFGCYGESNHNTANTGCDFLIGNTNKANIVTIEGNHSHGQGDGTNYQRDFVKVVAAKSVVVRSSLGSKLASANGYSRGYIRLETTFPAAGDTYNFQNNVVDISGTLYSDANGLITSSTKDECNSLAVRVSNGGTGLTSGTSGGIPFYNSASSMTPSALLAANAIMVGGGVGTAPSTVTTGTGILTALAANVGSAGAPVTFNGALGTPSSGVATNLTGTAAGLTAGSATTSSTVTTNANLTGPITSVGNATSVASQTGTGSKFVMDTNPVLVTPNLGTPSAGVLTNATGLPVSTGISGLAAGAATFLTTPSSANLRTLLTDEVGTGTAYFVGGALSTPASGTGTNLTGIPITTGLTGFAATKQVFTSGTSATYTTPANCKSIRIRMVGGGGGGTGSGTAPGTPGAATATTFSTFSAGAGAAASAASGGAGGTSSGGSYNASGYTGQNGSSLATGSGGTGGISPFGGPGWGGFPNQGGQAASANTGSGGGGSASVATASAGAGGGSGGYLEGTILAPSATYTYTVGVGGTGGTAGTGGGGGGTGGSGLIIVDEFYS